MSEKEKLIKSLEEMGIDIYTLLVEPFLGYKYRKSKHILYKDDDELPTKLIRIYYGLNPDTIHFDNMKKNFISQYMKQESELESVHCEEEKKGLGEMYRYIHNNDMDLEFEEARRSNWFCKNYTDYVLKKLHTLLYTYAPHPELAGTYRQGTAYLDDHARVELCDWSIIKYKIMDIDEDVIALKEMAKDITNIEDMLAYLDICVEIMCKLIKIHPFIDGNGRTIRCFTNLLLEEVNFPPVYLKANEKLAYNAATDLANIEGDYSAIKNFYRYKIIDSIIELDINQRLKEEKREDQRVAKKDTCSSKKDDSDVKVYTLKKDRK